MSTLPATPGQTVGPFFGFALAYADAAQLVPHGFPSAVLLTGRVLDGAGQPVPDALLEIWQPDDQGEVCLCAGSLHRDGRSFSGWGRAATDAAGCYCFTTLRPRGFVAMAVFARGLGHRLLTRVYPPEAEPDALLLALADDRAATLIAQEETPNRLEFDVYLQGDSETVFLSFPSEQT
jgi:protocatechuate 3,4-dioxygenase, alpha subunit